ncbi:class I SAM-dependent methyltransferase [Halosimplex amylolyticum]|uniref:class I SAM-dependent methyltransferase n=1 Tax=Halosimplex amylolyticum TaxID=3396616 RepID=UPI003F56B394
MEQFQNTGQPDWDWWGRLWPTPGATLRRLGVESGETLAEVGSGNGYFALPAARITDPRPVYAVDVDESLLEELESLAALQGIDNVVTVHADARDLADTLPEAVDTVLVANTFHGVSEPDRFVREVFDALGPDGRFVVVNWDDRPREETTVMDTPRGPPTDLRLSPSETKSIVTDAVAVANVRRIELPPYHYALRFER